MFKVYLRIASSSHMSDDNIISECLSKLFYSNIIPFSFPIPSDLLQSQVIFKWMRVIWIEDSCHRSYSSGWLLLFIVLLSSFLSMARENNSKFIVLPAEDWNFSNCVVVGSFQWVDLLCQSYTTLNWYRNGTFGEEFAKTVMFSACYTSYCRIIRLYGSRERIVSLNVEGVLSL